MLYASLSSIDWVSIQGIGTRPGNRFLIEINTYYILIFLLFHLRTRNPCKPSIYGCSFYLDDALDQSEQRISTPEMFFVYLKVMELVQHKMMNKQQLM
jgi:hypothetical protein